MFFFLVIFSFCCIGIGCLVGAVVSFVLARSQWRQKGLTEYAVAVGTWVDCFPTFASLDAVKLHATVTGPGLVYPQNVTSADFALQVEDDPYRNTEEGQGFPDQLFYKAAFYAAGARIDYPWAWRFHPLATSVSDAADVTEGEDDSKVQTTVLPQQPAQDPFPVGFLPEVDYGQLQALTRTLHVGGWVNFSFTIGSSTLNLEAMPLVRLTSHLENAGIYDRCYDLGGFEKSGETCWLYEKLKSVCIQVKSSGGWSLNQRNAGLGSSYGCHYDSGKWTPFEYERVEIHSGPGTVWPRPDGSADFTQVGVEVRSAQDPLFGAMELTSGGLSFGWTEEEEDVLSLVLLVVGIALVLQPLCIGYRRYRSWAKGGHPSRNWRRYRAQDTFDQYRHRDAAEMIGMRYETHDDL